jgi:lipoic acid synthetase
MLHELGLHTVCQEAHCPNVGECWREGTATVMLLGGVCTRGCRFCAVEAGHPGPIDPSEPEHVAQAIAQMGLAYVVLTMVDRDDLPDGGAGHVVETITRLRTLKADLRVEALVGDFHQNEQAIDAVVDAAPDVFAHNVEVVRRVTPVVRDVRCGYDRSLSVLERAKKRAPDRLTKSSIMVGIGETDDEVFDALVDLRSAGVDIVTIGQYLRPSAWHAEVTRYVPPATFEAYRERAQALGFRYAASGPLVRSSYRAAEVFVRSIAQPQADRVPLGRKTV